MNPKRLLVILVLALVLPAKGADQRKPAPDRKVFGMLLGGRFTLGECPTDKRGRYDKYKSEGPCFTFLGREKKGETLEQNPKIVIEFPILQDLAPSRSSTILATVLNGRLEAISMSTHGVRTVDRDLKILTAKYGEPHQLQRRTVQTAGDGTFEAVSAFWVFEDLAVTYESAFGRLDLGLIMIDTPQGESWKAEQTEKTKAEKIPL